MLKYRGKLDTERRERLRGSKWVDVGQVGGEADPRLLTLLPDPSLSSVVRKARRLASCTGRGWLSDPRKGPRSPAGGEGGRKAKIGRRAAVWADGRAIYLCFVPRSHFLAEEVLGLPLSVSGASYIKKSTYAWPCLNGTVLSFV